MNTWKLRVHCRWVIGYSDGAEGAVDEETARRATVFQQNAASYKAGQRANVSGYDNKT